MSRLPRKQKKEFYRRILINIDRCKKRQGCKFVMDISEIHKRGISPSQFIKRIKQKDIFRF